MVVRIGFGYDVHRLVEDHKLILGGVHIAYPKGCIAHSDGDTLVHAIIDSLLGAASKRDVGVHFPDSSAEFKNIDSLLLLQKTNEIISEAGYRISNIDCTICLEEPKLSKHIPLMSETIAKTLHIDIEQINIKAGTNEKMGFVGTGEGIAVYSVALLEKS